MHDQPLLRMSLPSIPSFVLSGLLLLCLPFSSFASATTSHISFSYAARQRMQNRARLLKQYQTHLKKQASYIVEGNAESRRALRQHNREQIKQHPEWFPAPLKASDRRWQALVENNHFLSSDHLHNITEVAIHRLEQQLGKPYVWGGTRPDQGFDCSGLVFYAYNKILEAKLPRTRCSVTPLLKLSETGLLKSTPGSFCQRICIAYGHYLKAMMIFPLAGGKLKSNLPMLVD